MSKSGTIKSAWIGATAVVIAAVIAGFFGLMKHSQPVQSITAPGATGSPLTVMGEARDVTINYNVPDTATQEAIRFLRQKADDTDTKIEFTRKELLFLSQALQDLDQRTSGIQKLPDGRTSFGHFVSGVPKIVIGEHEAARALFEKGDYIAALEHSKNAIRAYEETARLNVAMSTGNLEPENVGKIYRLAAMITQSLRRNDQAQLYAAKAAEISPSAENNAFLATTLFNIGKFEESVAAINKALQREPENKKYIQIKSEIIQKAPPLSSSSG